MQGISTKVTAATLATAALTIINWALFDKFGLEPVPESVADAASIILIFVAGYFTREKAPAAPPVAE